MKTTKSMAEEQFAAVRRQAQRAQTEHEVALQERAEHIAKLRALRLAKEATDRETAENGLAIRVSAEGKKSCC
jgi:hypothetical protein